MYEILGGETGKFYQLLYVSFEKHEHFGKMKDDEIIQQTSNQKPYFMKYPGEIEISFKVRDQYMVNFGRKYCNCQCPYMKTALRIQKSKVDDQKNNNDINNHNTFILDPFVHCPYFGDKYDNDDEFEFVLDHLSSYDHFQSFDIAQKHCDLGNICKMYQGVLNADNCNTLTNKHNELLDRKHLYLYHHHVANSRSSRSSNQV